MTPARLLSLSLVPAIALQLGCASSTSSSGSGTPPPAAKSGEVPKPDPRIGLRPGMHDAGEAVWNLRVVSETPSPEDFAASTNTDLAFTGHHLIQGNYNGYQVWDIKNPRRPELVTGHVCPASQSDVSVYRNLLFVSGEDLAARLDCGTQGVQDTVSTERLRGVRIFDISDLRNPRNVGNVQTCRGSHTHSVLVDPKDTANVYVYISGSSVVRSPNELPGCLGVMPAEDSTTAWFRIEVIKVPLAHPERAEIVSSPRIFDNLVAPPRHGETAEDSAAAAKELADAKAAGHFTVKVEDEEVIIPTEESDSLLARVVEARGGSGTPTAADSALLRRALSALVVAKVGAQPDSASGPNQCHDITLYPAIGLAGGACEGYGMLLDIRDPARPVRIAEVADSNFSYWHSATFNNDGSKILFSDEWGGGSQAKCRATDKPEWGADAIFTIAGGRMQFQSYYKIPAPQTPQEICVAHNGSLIPIPGRDVMVQAWYQGGLSVLDWTDPANPKEIAFFDRGPVDSTRLASGGYWSTYWYNGLIYGSEIARGLDVFELIPSAFLTANEIEAAKSVRLEYFNAQGQPKTVWPVTFALARAYLDQLERSQGLEPARIASAREALTTAEKGSDEERRAGLTELAAGLETGSAGAGDSAKVRMLAGVVKELAAAPRLAGRS
jgi:hypothetical protein